MFGGWEDLKEHVAFLVGMTFVQFCLVCQMCTFLDWHVLLTVTHVLVTFRLDYCNGLYMRLPLKSVRKLQLYRMQWHWYLCVLIEHHIIMLVLWELHWLQFASSSNSRFWFNFPNWFMAWEWAIWGLPFLDILAHSIGSGRADMLQVSLARNIPLVGPWRRAFSIMTLALWNISPLP